MTYPKEATLLDILNDAVLTDEDHRVVNTFEPAGLDRWDHFSMSKTELHRMLSAAYDAGVRAEGKRVKEFILKQYR